MTCQNGLNRTKISYNNYSLREENEPFKKRCKPLKKQMLNNLH